MTPELADDLRVLIDRDAPTSAASIDVTSAVTLGQVQSRLGQHFAAPNAAGSVELVIGETRVGPVTEKSLRRSRGTVAEPP
jgi:hypothetical protein